MSSSIHLPLPHGVVSTPSGLLVSQSAVVEVVRAEYATTMRASAGDPPAGRADLSSLRLSWQDRMDVVALMLRFDRATGARIIEDVFSPAFFETNFWYGWSAGFAFRPWHAATEFKRYLWLHIRDLPRVESEQAPGLAPMDALAAVFMRHLAGFGFRFAPGPSTAPRLAAAGTSVETYDGEARIVLPSGGLRALCRPKTLPTMSAAFY